MSQEHPADRVLRGRLEDGDGRPVAGARLRAEGGDEEARSGADGGFGLRVSSRRAVHALEVVDRGGTVRVLVAADAPEGVRVVVAGTDAVPLRVLTPATAPVPTRFGWLALQHGPGGLVAGPVGDATAPRFAVRGLSPGTWALVVWAGPFLPAVVDPVALDGATSAGLHTVELMRRGASVAGRVLTPTRVPRPGVRVTLRPEDASVPLPPARASSVTDAGGRWRVEGLLPGRYTVVVDAGAGPPTEQTLSLLEREERSMDLVP